MVAQVPATVHSGAATLTDCGPAMGQPVRGLTYLLVANARAPRDDAWITEMQEEAVSVATEQERRKSVALVGDWLGRCGKS